MNGHRRTGLACLHSVRHEDSHVRGTELRIGRLRHVQDRRDIREVPCLWSVAHWRCTAVTGNMDPAYHSRLLFVFHFLSTAKLLSPHLPWEFRTVYTTLSLPYAHASVFG